MCFFFFSSRRRHTRSTRDWSSDVCSSDLARGKAREVDPALVFGALAQAERCAVEIDPRGPRGLRRLPRGLRGRGERSPVLRGRRGKRSPVLRGRRGKRSRVLRGRAPGIAPRGASRGVSVDDELNEVGHHRPRGAAAKRWLMRDLAPAENGEVLVGGEPFNGFNGDGALGCRPGEEGRPNGVCARFRQGKRRDLTEETIRDLGHDARAVAGVGLASLRTPVLQVAQDRQSPGYGVVTAAAGKVSYEPNAAGVVFVAAVIQTSTPARGDRTRKPRGVPPHARTSH